MDDEEMARKFHNTYERLAPQFGYETREETKQFDPSSANGQLMIAVCREVGQAIRQDQMRRDREAGVGFKKPEWADAPEWAEYLTLDGNGGWRFHQYIPDRDHKHRRWNSDHDWYEPKIVYDWELVLERRPKCIDGGGDE